MYKRSQEIENRLQELVGLIRKGGYSTPLLAKALNTSSPTVSRCLSALRERGYQIRSVRDEKGWSYEIVREAAAKNSPRKKAVS